MKCAKCAMTGKEVRCPTCNSSDITFYYKINETEITCHNQDCKAVSILYEFSDSRYPQVKLQEKDILDVD